MNRKLFKGVLYNILSLVALFLPFTLLMIWKYDEWVTVAESTDIAIGVMIGLVYAIFIMKGALKSLSPKIATLISMFVFVAIIYFLDGIMEDLFWVTLSINIGYILFLIISAIGSREIKQYQAYRDERARVVARQEAQSEIEGV